MTQSLQEFIIEDLNVTPVIDPAYEHQTRVKILKDTLKASGRKGFAMSVTNEQSSILAAQIAQQAVAQLRKETGDLRYLFLALHLPEGQQDAKEVSEAAQLIRNFIKADGLGCSQPVGSWVVAGLSLYCFLTFGSRDDDAEGIVSLFLYLLLVIFRKIFQEKFGKGFDSWFSCAYTGSIESFSGIISGEKNAELRNQHR